MCGLQNSTYSIYRNLITEMRLFIENGVNGWKSSADGSKHYFSIYQIPLILLKFPLKYTNI